LHDRAETLVAAVGITALAVVGMDAATYAGTGDSKPRRYHGTAAKPAYAKGHVTIRVRQ
jgi:hypothetical protein